jgi:multidrug efflux pump
VLRHPLITILVFLGTVLLNIHLYVSIPKGFFPQQDTGRIVGGIRADQSISFQAMRRKFRQFIEIVRPIRRSRALRASPVASRPTPASCSRP